MKNGIISNLYAFLQNDNSKRKKIGICLVIATVLLATSCYAKDLFVGRFSHGDLAGWNQKIFKGKTLYRLVVDDGKEVLQAISNKAASGLIKNISFNPRTYRYLRWSWKIAHIIKKGDARFKKGDDYAARIYVIFPGTFFWQTKAINYIWANRLPKGTSIPNAFTDHAMMIAVESGAKKVGRWVHEQRDIVADYRRLFGSEPDMAGGVAIMTDTDNTQESAVAWYGDIVLSTNPVKRE
jgi:hypothetical protein